MQAATFLTLGSLIAALPMRAEVPRTIVSIVDGQWQINGQVTYQGAKAQGLLLNVRMVNAAFEDRNRSDFDPEANSNKILPQISDYLGH